jgi:anti-sigma factor RsiW
MTMSNQAESEQRLQELNRLLEAYGADKVRWPAADRIRLSSFIAIDPRGKAAVAEAAALDRLLDMAPCVSIDRERSLAQRIVSAAASSAPSHAQPGKVVPLPVSAQSSGPFLRSRVSHAAGALLAASLVLGIFAGISGQLSATLDYVAEAVGLSDDEPELAFYAEPFASAEETL